MSPDDLAAPTNASGESPAEDAPAACTRIEYFRSYQAAVQSPNWVVNLLWGMLALISSGIIFIVGPMIWTGYLYDCVEELHTSRGRSLPDFDVNKFSDYLTRGVWPFLVQLVIWFALAATYVLSYIGLFVLVAVSAGVGEEYTPIVFAIGLPLLALALAAVVIVPLMLLSPLMLRAGLSQDLAIGFKLSWWRDFFRRVGLELVLTTLFVLVTGTLLTTLGCFLVIIGSYVAWAWVTLANAHLSWQLYELYLSRGGEPVPLKPRKLAPPPYRYPGYGPPGYPPANYPAPPTGP